MIRGAFHFSQILLRSSSAAVVRLHRLAAAARQNPQLHAALRTATAMALEQKADEEPHIGHALDVGLRSTIPTSRQQELAMFVPILARPISEDRNAGLAR